MVSQTDQAERTFTVLAVEDNPGDIYLLQFLFETADRRIQLHFVADGEQASDFLFRRGAYAERTDPDLVLLDLNLPRKDGRALLQEMRSEPELRRIPVLMLSTSCSDAEILEAYSLGANAFLSKPVNLDSFQGAITALCRFWFGYVDLPGGRTGGAEAAPRPSL